ncbi:hypothetical protein [Rhodococcoides kyotonense]|uniref:Homeodomain-like domain-containing protein n=1 Tax=Rhodococcoides kyotonense TaxID=398843 RepID=A0A177YEF0_9NOCA|nr:hypothetical protein [Rhodococcus kyotonensis]OAK53831.1 hypothetical protein A3K89_22195 [Rhodococcus kyotonensis]
MDSEKKLTAAELTAMYDEYKAALDAVELAEGVRELGRTDAPKWIADAAHRRREAVSDFEALEINAFLASTMIADRYAIIERLRSQSPPTAWSKIGDVLGMSKQAVHQWYGGYNLRPRVKNPTEPDGA